MKRLIVTGGGTAGHVNAGLSIIDEYKKQYKDGLVLFVGTKRGIESKLVSKAGVAIKYINSRGLNKENLPVFVYSIFLLPMSFIQSLYIVFSFRPDAVIGVGGFCSGPVLLASFLLRKKIFILEQNTIMGLTNRIASKFAKKIFTAFPILQGNQEKMVFCGNPIRTSIKLSKRITNDKFNVFIFGGSQGSYAINKCITDSIPLLNNIENLCIYHQTGKIDYERVLKEYKNAKFEHHVFDYTYDIASIYDKTNLVICRSGASTIFELISAGLPSLLIPLPSAADNHQYFNAKFLSDKKAGILLEQKDLNPEKLKDLINDCINNPSILLNIIKNISSVMPKGKKAEEIIIETVQNNV